MAGSFEEQERQSQSDGTTAKNHCFRDFVMVIQIWCMRYYALWLQCLWEQPSVGQLAGSSLEEES